MALKEKHMRITDQAWDVVKARDRKRFPTERDFINEAILTYADRMKVMLAPYLKVRLSPYQLILVKRVRHIGRYLEAKNSFAVKWYSVRKDAMETGKLFEECMYLLEHDIRSREDLAGRMKSAAGKERNMLRRILKRTEEEEDRNIVTKHPDYQEEV